MFLAFIASLLIGTCFGWMVRHVHQHSHSLLAAFVIVICGLVSAGLGSLFGSLNGALALGMIAGLISFLKAARSLIPN